MSTVGKVRLAIVVAALLLLWSQGSSVASVAGAVTAVAFFWWFVGGRRPRVDTSVALACLTALWIADLFFRVEVMHHSGERALYVSGGLLVVAFALTVGLCIDSLRSLIAVLRRRAPRTEALRGVVVLCVVTAGPTAHLLLPALPFHSFLWRHENGFLEDIRSGSSDEDVRHYVHGSAFRFSWYTISNASFYIVYEPDRPPGQQLLGRDTDAFYPGGHSVRHLRGPWYAVFH